MNKLFFTCFFSLIGYFAIAQKSIAKKIKEIQKGKFSSEICNDFVRNTDIEGVEKYKVSQIFVIRHGEPALDKRKWMNRKEFINYTKRYDSVGVYCFEKKPICLKEENKNHTIYSSKLPRAMDTAEKTFGQSKVIVSQSQFNEFERKVINFPNIKLPRQFWSISTRLVWILGFNKKGIESFSQAKDRSRRAALFLDQKADNHGDTILFSHGFLNKYIKKYLKKLGYYSVNLQGQKYLGSYYFYKLSK